MKCIEQVISIRNLKIPAIIGVYDQERLKEQDLICNLELKIRLNAISISDKLCDTIDYATVASRLSAFIKTQKSHLIENLAHLAVQQVFEIDSRICNVRLEIFKPGCVPDADGASVLLSYSKNEFLE